MSHHGSYGPEPYGPGPYGPPPGQAPMGPYGYGVPAPPPHPSAKTAMVLGVVALAGGLSCLLPIVAGPFAWAKGARALREIDASRGRLSGRGDAQAGMILGIVSTALLACYVVVFAFYAAVVVAIIGAAVSQT